MIDCRADAGWLSNGRESVHNYMLLSVKAFRHGKDVDGLKTNVCLILFQA
jgi:hypothetical protein